MKSGIVTDINIHDSTIIVKRKIRIIPIYFYKMARIAINQV